MNASKWGSLGSILDAVYQHGDPQGHVFQRMQLQDRSSLKEALHLHREYQLSVKELGAEIESLNSTGVPPTK